MVATGTSNEGVELKIDFDIASMKIADMSNFDNWYLQWGQNFVSMKLSAEKMSLVKIATDKLSVNLSPMIFRNPNPLILKWVRISSKSTKSLLILSKQYPSRIGLDI